MGEDSHRYSHPYVLYIGRTIPLVDFQMACAGWKPFRKSHCNLLTPSKIDYFFLFFQNVVKFIILMTLLAKSHFLNFVLSLRTHQKYTFNPTNKNNSAILCHINCQNCVGNMDNFKIIGSATNDFHLKLKESLLIHKNRPKINGAEKSIPLELFEWFYYDIFSFISMILFVHLS